MHSRSTFPALALLVLLLPPLSALAQQWRALEWTDTMTDEKRRVAAVTLKSGHAVSLGRVKNGTVWMAFNLPRAAVDAMDPARAPMIRVDQLPAQDLAVLQAVSKQGVPVIRHTARSTTWFVWIGKGGANIGPLRNLMDGHSLRVRYYLASGTSQELLFPLEGAKSVIAELLEIPAEADLEAAAREKALAEERRKRIRACNDEFAASRNRAALAACLKGQGSET
jgi:hypothetical protein